MKKVILATLLSAFSFTAAAAHACDGMKGHDKSDTNTQSKKQDKKIEPPAKTDQKT